MKTHKIIHTRDKPFTCEECSYSVSRKYELRRHKETKHSNQTDEKLFQCDSCDRRWRSPSELKVHKRIHNGEKLFQCPLCDKRFSTSGDVTKHKIVHTQDRPYTCKECLRSFSRKYDLLSHKKYKHGQNTTDEKFFQCDSCDRRCRTSGNLKVNKRIHTG